MTSDLDDSDSAYAADLRRQDAMNRQLAAHRAEHWHPHDPEYIDDELEEVCHEG